MANKTCVACKNEKNICEFNKCADSSDRHSSYCRECSRIYKKKWYDKNKKYVRKYNKKHYENNQEYHSRKNKLWMKNNREKRAEYSYNYTKNKLKTDVNYKIAHSLRRRLRNAIHNNQKSGSAVKDLGCTVKELKFYLENKFYPNPKTGEQMSWDNYGYHGWHIDHIRPLISFDLTNREQFLEANHYTNLQPLWAEDNFKKGIKYE